MALAPSNPLIQEFEAPELPSMDASVRQFQERRSNEQIQAQEDQEYQAKFREQLSQSTSLFAESSMQALRDTESGSRDQFAQSINPLTNKPQDTETASDEDIMKSISYNLAYQAMYGTPKTKSEQDFKYQQAKVKANPNSAKLFTGIWDTAFANFEVAYNVGKRDRLASRIKAKGKDSPTYDADTAEMMSYNEKVIKLRETYDVSNAATLPTRVVNATMNAAGSSVQTMKDSSISGLMGGTAASLAAIPSGPAGMAAAFGWGYGVTSGPGMFISSQEQQEGALFFDMHFAPDVKTGNVVPFDIAAKRSTVPSLIGASLETIGLKGMTSGPFKKMLTSSQGRIIDFGKAVALGTGTETVVEGLQSPMQLAARNLAIREAEEATGQKYTEASAQQMWESSKEGMEQGMLGGGGMSAGSAAAGAAVSSMIESSKETGDIGTELPSDAVTITNAIMEASDKQQGAEIIAKIVEREIAIEETNRALNPAQVIDEETGVQQESLAPLSEFEIERMNNQDGVLNTSISRNLIDDYIADDSISLLDEVDKSISESYSSFSNTLRSILPDESQARAIESLIEGRARALGISPDQYIDNRGLSLKQSDKGTGQSAQVEFIKDSQTVITAFQGADVTSIAHELGHVFRRDLDSDSMGILNKWVGLDPKADSWNAQQEEQFARAFENYLANGKAPTKELASVFQQFSKWMLETYKSIKGSLVDVQMTPEVEGVMQDMLGRTRQVETAQYNGPSLLEQRQEKTMESEIEDASTKIAQIQLSDKSPRDMYKAQLALLREKALSFRDIGDHQGYNRAKNEIAALLTRRREGLKLASRHKQVKGQLKTALKQKRPKKVNGQLRSPLNSEATGILQMLRSTMSSATSKKKAQEMLQDTALDFAWSSPNVSQELKLKKQLLYALSKTDEEGTSALVDLLREVKSTLEWGKEGTFRNKISEWAKTSIPLFLDDILGEGVAISDVLKHATAEDTFAAQNAIERMKTGTIGKDLIYGLRGLLDIAAQKGPDTAMESSLVKLLETYKSNQNKMTEVNNDIKVMESLMSYSYGLKTKYSIYAKMNSNTNTVIDIEGDPYTKGQLITIWAQFKNHRTAERHFNTRGGNGFIEGVSDALSDQDKAYADSMVEYLNRDEVYDRTNKVHKEYFNISMPRIPGYFPVSSVAMGETKETETFMDIFQDDFFTYGNANTHHTKSRVASKTDAIKLEDVTSLFLRYSEETSHFRNYAEIGSKLNKTFNDTPAIKEAIIARYGQKFYRQIQDSVEAILNDGRNQSVAMQYADRFRTGFVKTAVAGSVGVFSKQLISTVNYWENMPLHKYVEYMGKFMLNPVKNSKDMMQIQFFKNRWETGSVDRDFKSNDFSSMNKKYRLNPVISNLLTMNVKVGDAIPIITGGWAYRQYLMDVKGMTLDQANDQVGLVSEQSQQSGATSERSAMQRSDNAFAKLATTFSSGPVQAERKVIDAFRQRANKKISRAQFAKKLFIYQVLVPSMYSVAGDALSTLAGKGPDEDEFKMNLLASSLLGPASSIYTVGRTMYSVGAGALGVNTYATQGPFEQSLRDMVRVPTKLLDGDELELTDAAAFTEGFMILIGKGGVPFSRLANVAEGAIQGDEEGLKQMLIQRQVD